MNKNYFLVLPTVATMFLATQSVQALVKLDSDKWAAQSARLKEKLNEQREKVCKNTQARINERWEKYYAKRADRVDNMDKGLTLLESRVSFYKSKELDTTSLETDITALTGLVGEYKTEYLKFLNILEGAKTLPCANYEGEFLPKLKAAKDQWLVVKQMADSIRDYYRINVKKHLEELRAQLKEGDEE